MTSNTENEVAKLVNIWLQIIAYSSSELFKNTLEAISVCLQGLECLEVNYFWMVYILFLQKQPWEDSNYVTPSTISSWKHIQIHGIGGILRYFCVLKRPWFILECREFLIREISIPLSFTMGCVVSTLCSTWVGYIHTPLPPSSPLFIFHLKYMI